MRSIPDMFFAISHWLTQNTGYDLANWLTGIVSFVTVFLALGGGWVALKSYVASNAATSHAHMHQMFMQFLEARDARIDREEAARITARKRASPSANQRQAEITSLREDLDFGGAALYYLEEVHAWVRREESSRLARYYPLLFSKRERLVRRDIIESWKSTLAAQLSAHRSDVLESLKSYTSCYGASFLVFAAATFAASHPDDDLSAAAEAAEAAMLAGKPRPLGTRERQPD